MATQAFPQPHFPSNPREPSRTPGTTAQRAVLETLPMPKSTPRATDAKKGEAELGAVDAKGRWSTAAPASIVSSVLGPGAFLWVPTKPTTGGLEAQQRGGHGAPHNELILLPSTLREFRNGGPSQDRGSRRCTSLVSALG